MTTEGEYKIIVHLIHGEPIKFKVSPTEAEMMAKGDLPGYQWDWKLAENS